MYVQLADYIHNSMVNGEGIRDVIFFSGCAHRCPGCHNPATWNFNFGEPVTVDFLVDKVLSNKDMIDGVTISGGDPFYQYGALLELCKQLKQQNINIWVYTGFSHGELLLCDFKDIFKYVDVIVDGKYDQRLKDETSKYRGSWNQRLLHFKNGKLDYAE